MGFAKEGLTLSSIDIEIDVSKVFANINRGADEPLIRVLDLTDRELLHFVKTQPLLYYASDISGDEILPGDIIRILYVNTPYYDYKFKMAMLSHKAATIASAIKYIKPDFYKKYRVFL